MKTYVKRACIYCIVGFSLQVSACVTSGNQGDSHRQFHENMPRSILVLPPINESENDDASYSWLTTASRPIAENGYYVFPVAVVDAFMKQNGLRTPGAMHAIPLRRLGEVFGADAIMYATVEEFGKTTNTFDSVTIVHLRAQLVDVYTGRVIWSGRVDHTENTTKGVSVNLLSAVSGSGATRLTSSLTDADGTHAAVAAANWLLFKNNFSNSGLLWGPSHPEFEGQLPNLRRSSAKFKPQDAGWTEIKSGNSDR